MKSVAEIDREIVEDFELFDQWPDRYHYIIELGQKLDPMPPEYKVDQNKVKGCQSSVWIFPERKGERLFFHCDSDSVFVKGEIALLMKLLQNRTPDEILNAPIHFIEEIGLQKHIAPTRANGLVAIIKQVKYYALALSAKND
ncbi:MAG TPA: SufE family protein [Bacteroidia bacterium]|nr:SufE family protein [Bacteroidia bacterium]HNT79868.1 SufE family protein [Bacteroidia bacterium]